MEVRATAKYVGISPQKLDLLADTVRGKKVNDALGMLSLSPSPSARALAKVIKSAAANAENNYQMVLADLKVVRLVINQGSTLKRMCSGSRTRKSHTEAHEPHHCHSGYGGVVGTQGSPYRIQARHHSRLAFTVVFAEALHGFRSRRRAHSQTSHG